MGCPRYLSPWLYTFFEQIQEQTSTVKKKLTNELIYYTFLWNKKEKYFTSLLLIYVNYIQYLLSILHNFGSLFLILDMLYPEVQALILHKQDYNKIKTVKLIIRTNVLQSFLYFIEYI